MSVAATKGFAYFACELSTLTSEGLFFSLSEFRYAKHAKVAKHVKVFVNSGFTK
jgi:hypothetical protein